MRQQHGGRIGKETPGGWGLNTLHGTAPRPLPCPLHGASSRSNPIPPTVVRGPRALMESGRARARQPDQIVVPDARWVLIIVDRRCDPSITKGKGTVVRLSYLQHTLISSQTPSVWYLSTRQVRDHTAHGFVRALFSCKALVTSLVMIP